MFTLIIAPLLENVTPPGAFNRSNTVFKGLTGQSPKGQEALIFLKCKTLLYMYQHTMRFERFEWRSLGWLAVCRSVGHWYVYRSVGHWYVYIIIGVQVCGVNYFYIFYAIVMNLQPCSLYNKDLQDNLCNSCIKYVSQSEIVGPIDEMTSLWKMTSE